MQRFANMILIVALLVVSGMFAGCGDETITGVSRTDVSAKTVADIALDEQAELDDAMDTKFSIEGELGSTDLIEK